MTPRARQLRWWKRRRKQRSGWFAVDTETSSAVFNGIFGEMTALYFISSTPKPKKPRFVKLPWHGRLRYKLVTLTQPSRKLATTFTFVDGCYIFHPGPEEK